MNNLKITIPSAEELEEYLQDLIEENGLEEGQLTDDSIMEIRDIILDYVMDSLEVEVF